MPWIYGIEIIKEEDYSCTLIHFRCGGGVNAATSVHKECDFKQGKRLNAIQTWWTWFLKRKCNCKIDVEREGHRSRARRGMVDASMKNCCFKRRSIGVELRRVAFQSRLMDVISRHPTSSRCFYTYPFTSPLLIPPKNKDLYLTLALIGQKAASEPSVIRCLSIWL